MESKKKYSKNWTPEGLNRLRDLAKSRTGQRNSNWRGGKVVRPDGRTLVYMPNHSGCSYNKTHILEYRLIAEQKLGRPLRSAEIVHHKDGNPSNNAIENLEILSFKEHAKIHAKSRRCPKTGRFLSKEHA